MWRSSTSGGRRSWRTAQRGCETSFCEKHRGASLPGALRSSTGPCRRRGTVGLDERARRIAGRKSPPGVDPVRSRGRGDGGVSAGVGGRPRERGPRARSHAGRSGDEAPLAGGRTPHHRFVSGIHGGRAGGGARPRLVRRTNRPGATGSLPDERRPLVPRRARSDRRPVSPGRSSPARRKRGRPRGARPPRLALAFVRASARPVARRPLGQSGRPARRRCEPARLSTTPAGGCANIPGTSWRAPGQFEVPPAPPARRRQYNFRP